MMSISLTSWLMACSPILTVLVLMIGFGWGGARAGAAGWFTAILTAMFFFGATPRLLAYAQMKGVLLSINVLYIIWAALVLYHVVNETGAIRAIGIGIQRFSSDKVIQLLLFGWVFASFLQGVAGYGVPIAVAAPLLVGMGFSPAVAEAVPAIAHSWSVTFGSMGASFQALIAVTGLDWHFLAPLCAGFLGLACYLCGLAAIHAYGGWRSLYHGIWAIFIVGTAMAGTQYILAASGMWTLGGFGASLVGLAAGLLAARLPRYRCNHSPVVDNPGMSLALALSGYLILIVVVSCGVIIEPLRLFLSQVKLSLFFPALVTAKGWAVDAGYGKKISIFGHGGALLLYATVLSYCLYNRKGLYKPGAGRAIIAKTVKSGVPTSLGIVSMVCFALVMDQCGMINVLAEGISRFFGKTYPFIASWIGLLGAFMTGSNTNSNVVFGVLQQHTAELSGISVAVILAAQTTGGALGSMIAPAKILVGCSTVGLAGKEAPVLRLTIPYGIVITAIVGLATTLAVFSGH